MSELLVVLDEIQRHDDSDVPLCDFCRREVPCECMSFVRDGGPLYEPITDTWGWSSYPERCMCTCGRCYA